MDSATGSSAADRPDPGRRRLLDLFLGGSLAALAGSILYPVLRFVSPPRVPEATTNQLDAGATNDPELVAKGYKILRFGAEPVILVRVSDTEFRAFSATCTHLACIVEYRKDRKDIYCNCHGGQYDLAGKNVAGPPPRPLAPFKVDLVAQGPGRPQNIVVSRT